MLIFTRKRSSQEDLFSSLNDLESNQYEQISINTSLSTLIGHSATTTTTTTTPNQQTSSSNMNKLLIQKVILSSISNVNLVHEILRNTYFLNFESYLTVQQVLNAYKKWFLKEAKMPFFMQEPSTLQAESSMQALSESENELNQFGAAHSTRSMSITSITSTSSLFSMPNNSTRIGYMRCLQIFLFHSSNLLLNRNNFQRDKIKNICCHTLEIYKLFIRKIKMDCYTWTMLITILLKVADFLFNSEYLLNNRNEPATSQLIKLMTEV